MEDAYVIGIRLALENGVSAGIAAIARELAALDSMIANTTVNLERLQAVARSLDFPHFNPPPIPGPAPQPPTLQIQTDPFPPPRPQPTRSQQSPYGRQPPELALISPPASAPTSPTVAPAVVVPTTAPPVIRVLTPIGNQMGASAAAVDPPSVKQQQSVSPPPSVEQPPRAARSPEYQPPAPARPIDPRISFALPPSSSGDRTTSRQFPEVYAPRPADQPTRPDVKSVSVAPTASDRMVVAVAQPAAPTYPGASAAPPARENSSTPRQGDVYLDGTKLGRWMADRLAAESDGPQTGVTGFDPRLSPTWPGALQGF